MIGWLRGVALFLSVTAVSCSASPPREVQPPVEYLGSLEIYRNLFSTSRQKYPVEDYLLGIGLGSTDQAAVELARADLVKQIRSEVTARWTDILRQSQAQLEQDLSRQIETQVTELTTGIQIVDRGRTLESGWSHAVAILKKSDMTKMLYGRPIRPQAPNEGPTAPDRREAVWVTAEGVVPFGEDVSLAEAKQRSRNEARRQAIERAVGTFVKGSTVVYNFVLAEDLVQSVVRGVVLEEQILSEGVREVDVGQTQKAYLYATSLRARVQPVPAERRGQFRIKGFLNKSIFVENEEMIITVVPSEDAYIHIFNVGQDHAVTVLLPNKFNRETFTSGGKELVFPNEDLRQLGIRLRVLPSSGAKKAVEKIKLIATRKNIDLVRGRFIEPVFQVYRGQETGLATDLIKELTDMDDLDWAEMTIPYEVIRK